uniref:Programmed cell death 2-like n=1 Tax=Nothobranchius kuhntae TaxID=321403 RepID=A0A1A8KAA4_NOTKU
MACSAQDSTLIGLCDGQLDPKRHRSSFLTNKVGGEPDWPPVFSRLSPRCGLCGGLSVHVVQIYCPLQASPYHRTLHLFACPRPDCSGRSESWTALRSQSLEAPGRPGPLPAPAPLVSDWCESADDWGMEDGFDGWGGGPDRIQDPQELGGEVPPVCDADVSQQLQHLCLSESGDPPVFCPFFINVVEESDLYGEDEELEHAQELLRDYERREKMEVGVLEESSCSIEKYEKTNAKHGDAAFSRFMKTISLCPQQILRYCRGGKPVFISKPPSSMAQLLSACSSCGGSRIFELQLMPALVHYLQRKDRSSEAELEFGTVLVYTCSTSCWTSGSESAVEEFCFVQTDPDQQLFK